MNCRSLEWSSGTTSFSPKICSSWGGVSSPRQLFHHQPCCSFLLLLFSLPRLLPPLLPDSIPPCNYHLRLQLKATTIKGATERGRGAARDGEKGTVEWETEGGEINETFVRTRTSTCNCTVQRRTLKNCSGDTTQKREEEGEKETRKCASDVTVCVCVCVARMCLQTCVWASEGLLTVFPLCFAPARFLPLEFPVSLSFP